MGVVAVPNTFSSGGTIVAAEHNSNFTTIYNEFNGNIENANIAAAAAIVDTKLAQITTGSKVNLSAVVATSQATGDVIYASSATVLTRLGRGTSGQILVMNDGATAPEWSASSMGIADGWASFNGRSSPPVYYDSYNTTGSVLDHAAAKQRVTWDTNFADSNYAILTGGSVIAGQTAALTYVSANATSFVDTGTHNLSTGADSGGVYIAAFGKQ